MTPLTNPRKCEICSKINRKSCCEWPFVKDNDCPGTAPSLTFHDVARIERFTGKKAEEFCSIRESCESVLEEIKDDFINKLYDGKKSIQLKNGHDRCIFLSKDGCKIFKARPKSCQIYPFWFEIGGKGKIRIFLDTGNPENRKCLIVKDNLESDLDNSLQDIHESPASMMRKIKEFVEETVVFEKYKENIRKKPISNIIEMIRKDAKNRGKYPI
jgi:Fe-S-cluster containining protein